MWCISHKKMNCYKRNLFRKICSFMSCPLRCGVVVITTAQLYSSKPELKFCAGLNPARGVLKIRDGEDLWQWSRLEIKLCLSSVNHTTKTNHHHHHHHHHVSSKTTKKKSLRMVLFWMMENISARFSIQKL